MCLPKDPIYDKHHDGFQYSGRVYGAEYKTDTYRSWIDRNNHDIPGEKNRNIVVMVPGRNVCHKGYTFEYKGYLMAGLYMHTASEFICVDNQL